MTDEHKPIEDTKKLRRVLAQTIPDETMKIANAEELIKTVEEFEEHGKKQHQIVTKILLDTLEDAAMEHQHLDFNVIAFQETTKDARDSSILLGSDEISERLNDETVPGRYDIEGLLGTGATGQVFAVHDNNFDRDIAVKFMHPEDAHNQKKLLRFIDEASVTAKLAHPNILPVHDLDYTDGALIYFTMGLADGKSLHDVIDDIEEQKDGADEKWSMDERVRILLQACNAIAYAHSQGIVHNDVKPSNIMVGEYGQVLVVDWGTATTAEMRADSMKRMLGTPIYMSPEQANRDNPNELSDIYCLGSTLYHLLTLRFPCWNDSIEQFWNDKREGKFQKASEEERKRIPQALLDIAEKAMEPKPENRYATVDAMIVDLENYLQGQAVSAHHDTIWDLIKRLYKKDPRVIWAGIAGLLIILSAAGWLYYEKTLSQSRWIVNETMTFNNSNMADITSKWDLNVLPGWDDQNIKPILENHDQYLEINDKINLIHDMVSIGPVNLTFKKRIPGFMRIKWEYTAHHDKANLNCYIGGPNRFDSYMFHVGAYGKRDTVRLTKGWSTLATGDIGHAVENGRTYVIEMQKTDKEVSLKIDGKLIISYVDPDMLVGDIHQKFGFDLIHPGTEVDNVTVEHKPLAQKISPITVAHNYFSNALYKDALEHYLKIRDVYTDTDMAIVALYRTGRCYAELHQYADAAICFKQFLKSYPDHELYNHVSLKYADILSAQKKWSELDESIDKLQLAQAPIFVRKSLFANIASSLKSHLFANPREHDEDVEINYFYILNRDRNSIKEDALYCLAKARHYAEKLDIEINYESSDLIGQIKSILVSFIKDPVLIHEQLGNMKSARYSAYILERNIEKLEEEFPENKDKFYTTLGLTDKLNELLKEAGTLDLRELVVQYPDNIYQAILENYPDDRTAQARLLLSAKKYKDIINKYPDMTREYIMALDALGRHRDVLNTFKEHKDVHSLRWFKIRTLAKLRQYENATKYAKYGSYNHSSLLVFKAFDDYMRGDKNAFTEVDNQELVKLINIERFVYFKPFLLIEQGDPELVKTELKKALAWAQERNFFTGQKNQDIIAYICGEKELDITQDFLSRNADLPFFKAMRYDLQGKHREAIALYNSMRRSQDFYRSKLSIWRTTQLRAKKTK